MRMNLRTRPWLALFLILGLTASASACPNCKEAVANQEGDAMRLANGYNHSILLMMAMPFALLGAGGFLVVRLARGGALPEL